MKNEVLYKQIKHVEDMKWHTKVELIDKKDPLSQLEASKSIIKDLFNDLLDETKGFMY